MNKAKSILSLLLFCLILPTFANAVEPVFIFVEDNKMPPLLNKLGTREMIRGSALKNLMKTLSPKAPEKEPEIVSPDPYVIRSARYVGKVKGESARFDATFEVVLFEKGPIRFQPPIDELAPINARVDGKAVDFTLDSQGSLNNKTFGSPWIPISGKGFHTVQLTFLAPVSRFGEIASLSLATPRVAMGELDLLVDEGKADIEIVPSTGLNTLSSNDKSTRVSAGLPFHGGIFARWSRRVERPIDDTMSEEVTEEPLIFDSKVMTKAVIHESWLSVERSFSYTIKKGKLQSLTINLPPKSDVLEVRGSNIQKWRIEKGKLSIDLETRFDKNYSLLVRTSTPLPPVQITKEGIKTVTIQMAGAVTEGASTEKGFLGVELKDEGESLPGRTKALTRIDPSELGRHRGRGVALAYKHIVADWQMPFTIIRRPRIETTTLRIDSCATVVRLTEDGASLVKQTWKVINNGAQFLQVTLPPTSGLMSCFVDNKARPAGRGASHEVLKIPLIKSTGKPGHLNAFPVEITYRSYLPAFRYSGDLSVQLAKVEPMVRKMNCTVIGPFNYDLMPCGGSLRFAETNTLKKWFRQAKRMLNVSCSGGWMGSNRGFRQYEVQSAPSGAYEPQRQDYRRRIAKPSVRRPMKQRRMRRPSPKSGRADTGMAFGDEVTSNELDDMDEIADSKEEAPREISSFGGRGGGGWKGKKSKVSDEEKERKLFMKSIQTSSARKGNLPVRISVAYGTRGKQLSFAQELIQSNKEPQTLKLGYVRRSFILLLQWFNFFIGLGLFLVILSSLSNKKRMIGAVIALAVIFIFDAYLLFTIPKADLLDYLLVGAPFAVIIHCIRWFEGILTYYLSKRRQRTEAPAGAEA